MDSHQANGPVAERPAGSVDSMNDYLSAGPSKAHRSGLGDIETCRICRGEGTRTEPLFHPCKCSGSIKFVHQDCLMEWLTHSHKKYCELCKTHFHFTKLYDERMPESLPTPVFLQRLFSHAAKAFIAWSRLVLVCIVWLGWLPWSMRAGWRFLFWLGDGGWASSDAYHRRYVPSEQAASILKVRAGQFLGDSPIDPEIPLFSPSTVSTSSIFTTGQAVQSSAATVAQTISVEPDRSPTYIFLHKVLAAFGLDEPLSIVAVNGSHDTGSLGYIGHGSRSLLSNVTYLRTLTPSAATNKLIVDILEGQIITLLVVLSFVLVFLIREWVVQQQFGINLGVELNDEVVPPDNEADALQARPVAPRPDAQIEEDESAAGSDNDQGVLEAARSDDDGDDDDDSLVADVRDTATNAAGTPLHEHPASAAGAVRQITYAGETQPDAETAEPDQRSETGHLHFTDESASTSTEAAGAASATLDGVRREADTRRLRPRLPSRITSSAAIQIQRMLEEEGLAQAGSLGSDEVMRMWNQSEGRTDDFIKIVWGEGRNAELILLLKALEKYQGVENSERGQVESEADAADIRNGLEDLSYDDDGAREPSNGSSGHARDAESAPSESIPAGKGKQVDRDDSAAHRVAFDHTDASSMDVGPPTPDGPGPSSAAGRRHASISSSATVEGDGSQHVPAAADTHQGEPAMQETDPNAGPPQAPAVAQQGLLDRVMNWCWGDLGAEQARANADENVLQQAVADHGLAAEDREDREGIARDDDMIDDDAGRAEEEAVPGGIAAAVEQQDAEAIEDAEDFDGVMELVGLRGPLTGLFQNAMFSAVLLSATIGCGVWIPYVWGKVVIVVLAHPFSLAVKLPLRWLSVIADLTVDLAVFSGAILIYWLDYCARLSLRLLLPFFPVLARYAHSTAVAEKVIFLFERSLERIAKVPVATYMGFSPADYPVFSVLAHESLSRIKQTTLVALGFFWWPVMALCRADPGTLWSSLCVFVAEKYKTLPVTSIFGQSWLGWPSVRGSIAGLLRILEDLTSVKTRSNIPSASVEADTVLMSWSATDRMAAIVAGYAFFCLLGAVYVRQGTFFTTSEQGRRVESVIQSILIQAGGVLKVVLIIGVEMIAFPLYCGALLDLALLPLFDGATVHSRINFTVSSPWTSVFVHWFVGTCYMFHFALFVSMCRKIMRSGVLYFIRDPDDPTFHPVRDVLERNVASQLRKIAFSALVYGALVIVCLGGIVWGLGHGFGGVFPIRWSSNEPIVEFPVDLLFYNFLMPSVVKFFRPSDGFYNTYTWWFRKCARALRLTWFLFDERKADEEGHHVRRTWLAFLTRKRGNIDEPVTQQDHAAEARARDLDAYFVRDGRFVRTPGSDLVRVPKGGNAFQEINELEELPASPGTATDGESELAPDPADLYTKVYIPPMFGLRIGLFIWLIWMFAAATGLSVTIVPLALGRRILALLIPNHLRMNDVYAFSIGLYFLGGLAYGILHHHEGIAWARRTLRIESLTTRQLLAKCRSGLVRLFSLIYTFVAFAFVLPGLYALLVELYFVIPTHTYFAADERHFIDLVQDWTLGVLYVKLVGRFILWYPNSRPARALRAITRQGWFNPDARLATRSVILPATVAMSLAALLPLGVGWLAIRLRLDQHSIGLTPSQIYRYSYPAVLVMGLAAIGLRLFSLTVAQWKQGIRDEVYLVGQRLHNLGESRSRAAAAAASRAVEQGRSSSE